MIESDILIFCFISIFDDSFNFKSFTVDVILNSLEKIFRFFTLINTEVTDMIFIDESLMSELCECFDMLWVLRAYQGWIELVSVSSSDLAQSLFLFINISLFNIIFLPTSHSTCVTNTFSSSLAQSLNIT